MTTQPAEASLQGVPVELRLAIFEAIDDGTKAVRVEIQGDIYRRHVPEGCAALAAINRVSKQFHHETKDLLYKHRPTVIFTHHSHTDNGKHLNMADTPYLSQIRNLAWRLRFGYEYLGENEKYRQLQVLYDLLTVIGRSEVLKSFQFKTNHAFRSPILQHELDVATDHFHQNFIKSNTSREMTEMDLQLCLARKTLDWLSVIMSKSRSESTPYGNFGRSSRQKVLEEADAMDLCLLDDSIVASGTLQLQKELLREGRRCARFGCVASTTKMLLRLELTAAPERDRGANAGAEVGQA